MDRADQTVLVVEDDEGVAQAFALLLRTQRHQVVTALNADDAVRAIEERLPAAIMLDLRLGAIDGLALLRQLRARADTRYTPVAVVTGDYFLDKATIAELATLGAEVHFKPLWLVDLQRIVDALLRAADDEFAAARRSFRLIANRTLGSESDT
jgi:two-component system phosphate regulon response regulator PhoB